MPPKKKKNAVTGYSIYLKDIRAQYERSGQYFPKNNQEAFLFIGPLWKKLSEEDKKRYNDMAKDEKRQGASDLESKFNSLGVSFAEIEADKREKEEYNDIMMNTIQNTVRNSDFNTTFRTQKFYLCHVNYFYSNNSGRFKPAEIALSVFNLKRGVLDTFHAFINPGPIETGYRFDAKRRMEETHKIPIEDPKWTCGERDYVKLLHQIKNFLTKDNPNGRIPPIYTMPDDEKNNVSISAVKSTIETLCEASSEEPSEFRIYDLTLLYHELRHKAVAESPLRGNPDDAKYLTLSMAAHDLDKDKFCYTKGIACAFHDDKDIGNFCSLSSVVRLVFTMSDYLLNYTPDEMVEGGHAPRNSIKVNKVYPHKSDEDEGNDDGDDGFKVIPLRKPRINAAGNVNITPHSMGQPMHPASVRLPIPQKQVFSHPVPASDSSYLRFQNPPQKLLPQEKLSGSDEPSSSIYEDAASTSVTPSLSQNTAVSGYTASASLSQSSYSSEISVDALPYIGRGRGLLRSSEAPTNINWALNAGRGARLRQKQ